MRLATNVEEETFSHRRDFLEALMLTGPFLTAANDLKKPQTSKQIHPLKPCDLHKHDGWIGR